MVESLEEAAVEELRVLSRAPGVNQGGGGDPVRREAIVQAAYERGLLIIGCGKSAVRFLPPLHVIPEEIDAALAVFADAIKACPKS